MRVRVAPWVLCLLAAGCAAGSDTEESADSVRQSVGELRHGREAALVNGARRALIFSVDGLHQSDLASFVAAHPSSALASLVQSGVEYTAARTTTPSDSFPGTLAFATGGTPKSTGVYYDDSYDRTLYAPGSACAGTVGTEALFDESIEFDDTKLFSGGIDPTNLPLRKGKDGSCTPVYPHDFVMVNTLFEVVRENGGYTAWSDKHPAYDILNGPSGHGVDDLYAPEINSLVANAPLGLVNGVDLHAALAQCDGVTNSLPLAKVTDYTTCVPTVMAYDDVKVQAILNEIDGKRSDAMAAAPVPTVFGMNFQEVSVAEKLPIGGYQSDLTPSAALAGAIAHVDASLGRIVAELKATGLFSTTLIVLTAKHGQSPIDKSTLAMEGGGHAPIQTVVDPLTVINTVDPNIGNHPFVNPSSGNGYDTLGHFQTDDVGLLWVQHSADATSTPAIVSALLGQAAAIFANNLPPGTVLPSSITSGAPLAALFGDAASDPVAAARAPDVFIQPNAGTIYSGSSKKIAEHGGGTIADTAVPLIISLPSIASSVAVTTPVTTTQIAPTVLRALGIGPSTLLAVRVEGTQVLPGLL